MPAGTDWFNYWTNARIKGGQRIEVSAPIDQIPLFVRAGSLVPIAAPMENTMAKQVIENIRVYPGADADFTMYDDDGLTYAYETGAGQETRLHWNDQTQRLTHTGAVAWTASDASLVEVMGR